MNEDRKQFNRVVAWLAIGAFFLFVAAIGVMYSGSLFAALNSVWRAVFPLVLGFVFAFVLNLIMSRLERIYFPNSDKPLVDMSRAPVCMIASLAIIVLIIAAILGLVIPELRTSLGVIEQGFFVVLTDAYTWFESNVDVFAAALDTQGLQSLEQALTDFATSITSSISNGDMRITETLASFFATVGGIAHGVFAFIVAVIFSLYVLLDKNRVFDAANSVVDVLFDEKIASTIRYVCRVINESFSSFISGQCIEAVILGTLCAIGMTIFGMPYAVSIGVCVGATALVPVFGAWLGGIVGFLMILTVDPMTAVWFIVFLIVLQQIETHLIYPIVVGSSVGVPAIWVFAGVLVGGALFGVLGMFLGVPTIATLRTLAIHKITSMRTKKGLSPIGAFNPETYDPAAEVSQSALKNIQRKFKSIADKAKSKK